MNFVLPVWLRASQPVGFPVALAVLLFWTLPVPRADGVKPVRNGSATNSAQAEALATDVQERCTTVATPTDSGATEGQHFCIGQPPAAHRLAYKTRLAERTVAADAVRADQCHLLPQNGNGVTKRTAGAVRGSGAGFGSSSEPKAMATSAQAAGTAASIASYSAGMVVTPAAHQEASRV